jgi:transcription initiation factor TFIID subunit TAF12
MSDELHVKRRPVEGGGGGGAAAAKNRFAKKKALIQELDREQRLEENRNIDLGDVADDNGSGGDVKQEDVEEEEKEETIPTLVPIVVKLLHDN